MRFLFGGADHALRCEMCRRKIDCTCPCHQDHSMDVCGICRLQMYVISGACLNYDQHGHYTAEVRLLDEVIARFDCGPTANDMERRDWLVHELCIALERQGVL